MFFLTFLIITILGTFIGTIAELMEVESENLLNTNLLNYELLPPGIIDNKTVYYILMYFVLLITGFFQLPIYLLYFIQVKNFLKNRTTNERYSRKRPMANKDIDRAVSGDSRSESMDSTGSSLLAVIRQAKEAEDIIKEFGDPQDYTGKSCECIYNEYAMCFKTTPPN